MVRGTVGRVLVVAKVGEPMVIYGESLQLLLPHLQVGLLPPIESPIVQEAQQLFELLNQLGCRVFCQRQAARAEKLSVALDLDHEGRQLQVQNQDVFLVRHSLEHFDG